MGDASDPAAALLITPDTQRLRVLMQFEGGTAVAEDHPLIRFPTSEPGWVRVAIPFTQFKGAPRMANYRLQEMRVFGDAPDTFFIGQITTVTDNDPISVEPLEEQVVSVNDRVEFVGSAEGGISGLKYSWDFDKSDGIYRYVHGAISWVRRGSGCLTLFASVSQYSAVSGWPASRYSSARASS